MTDIVQILREQKQYDLADEIVRIRERLAALEAQRAIETGTMQWPPHEQRQEQRQEFGIIDNVPPNAPR